MGQSVSWINSVPVESIHQLLSDVLDTVPEPRRSLSGKQIADLDKTTLEAVQWIVLQDNLQQPVEMGVSPFEDILGFKYVDTWFHGKQYPQSAMLWLQIPTQTWRERSVMHSLEDQFVAVRDLKRNTKYRTQRVFVLGVQFYGSPEQVIRLALAHQEGLTTLSSSVCVGFQYRVGQWAEEPCFAKNSDFQQGCGVGIHFVTNPQWVFDQMSTKVNQLLCSPVITRVLKEPAPFMYLMDTTDAPPSHCSVGIMNNQNHHLPFVNRQLSAHLSLPPVTSYPIAIFAANV